jgi:hypothetical protein
MFLGMKSYFFLKNSYNLNRYNGNGNDDSSSAIPVFLIVSVVR